MDKKASKTKQASRFKGYDNILAVRLRQLMKDRNTTQQELADKTGCSRQSIGQYMEGSNAPNIDKMILIAEYFDVSIDYLVGKDKEQTESEFVQSIVNYTGLDETSVEELHRLKKLKENKIEQMVSAVAAVLSESRMQNAEIDLDFINIFLSSPFNAVCNHRDSFLYEYYRHLDNCIELYNQVIDFEIEENNSAGSLFEIWDKFATKISDLRKQIRVERCLITDDFSNTLDSFVDDKLNKIEEMDGTAKEKLMLIYETASKRVGE